MTIRKLPSGRFQAIVKAGRTHVCSKSFPTRREAQAYYAREKAALAGGIDPRAGRASVRSLLPVWLEERKHAVSAKDVRRRCCAGPARTPIPRRRCRSRR